MIIVVADMIKPRIARRNLETSQKLGRRRWVIERSFAWINRFCRLVVRFATDAPSGRAIVPGF
jgi:transposase